MKYIIILILFVLLNVRCKPDHLKQLESIHKTRVNDIGFVVMSHKIDSVGWIMERGSINSFYVGDTIVNYFREDSLFFDYTWETNIRYYNDNLMLIRNSRPKYDVQYEWHENQIIGRRIYNSKPFGNKVKYEFVNNKLKSIKGKGDGNNLYYYSKNNLLERSTWILSEKAKENIRGDSVVTIYKRNKKGLLISSIQHYFVKNHITTYDQLQLPLRHYVINDDMDTTEIWSYIYYKNGKRYGGEE